MQRASTSGLTKRKPPGAPTRFLAKTLTEGGPGPREKKVNRGNGSMG